MAAHGCIMSVLIHNLSIWSDISRHFLHHWQNLKMKISHPRYLIPGRMEDMDVEFPACLQKQTSHECNDAQTNIVEKPSGLLFSFPEVRIIPWKSLDLQAYFFNLFYLFILLFFYFYFAGRYNSRGDNLFLASLAACWIFWKHFLIFIYILWNGEFFKWYELPYTSNALQFGGKLGNMITGLYLFW